MWYVSKRRQIFCSNTHKLVFYELIYDNYITVLPFFIEMIHCEKVIFYALVHDVHVYSWKMLYLTIECIFCSFIGV
jgi:hypothetical protein